MAVSVCVCVNGWAWIGRVLWIGSAVSLLMSKPFSESVYECGKCCKVLWRVRRLEKRHCTYNAGPFIIVCTVFKVKTLHQGQTAPSYSIKPRPISNKTCLIPLDLDFDSALHDIVIVSPKFTRFALIKVPAFMHSLKKCAKMSEITLSRNV